MVVEHRYVLSLDEIKAIRFRCAKCEAATSFRIDETVQFPIQCPGCKALLYDATMDTGDSGLLHSLPRIIKRLISRGSDTSEILLEIEADKRIEA